jgi:hypothetical protein
LEETVEECGMIGMRNAEWIDAECGMIECGMRNAEWIAEHTLILTFPIPHSGIPHFP